MRYFLIMIVLLCNGLHGFCQVDLFFPLSNEFNWASIEKKNQELKAEFIKNLPDEFEFYRQQGDMSNLKDYLHVVDFNGDGMDDVIFNGYAGNESMYIIVFINTGKSFVKIFTEHQEIYKIVLKNGKVYKLYIRDSGCCCEYIAINKVYNVDYSSVLPKITLINQMQYINNSVEKYPSYYFHKVIKFEVLNDQYDIRFSPIIDDTTEVGYCGELKNGNSLGKISLGSIGYALSKEIDSTGRIWWFVALLPNSKIFESIYHNEATLPNSYKLGWISSRFVKETNE